MSPLKRLLWSQTDKNHVQKPCKRSLSARLWKRCAITFEDCPLKVALWGSYLLLWHQAQESVRSFHRMFTQQTVDIAHTASKRLKISWYVLFFLSSCGSCLAQVPWNYVNIFCTKIEGCLTLKMSGNQVLSFSENIVWSLISLRKFLFNNNSFKVYLTQVSLTVPKTCTF